MTNVDYLRCNGMKLYVIHVNNIIHPVCLCAIDDAIIEVECGSLVTSSIQSKTIGDIQ